MATTVDLSESKVPVVHGVCIAFMIHTVAVVALRLYSRVALVKAIGADDILIVFAAIFSEAFCVIILISTKYGLGRHVETVTSNEMQRFLQVVWASAMAYNTTLGFIKSSSLALYLRLSPSPTFRRAVVFMIVVVTCQALANLISVIFQCNPVNFLWRQLVPGTVGKCIDINNFYLANAALTITTDFMTYALPMPTLWGLKMPKRQKIALMGILGLGGFAVLSSIIRITYVVPMLTSKDPTWVIAEPMYWSVIETNIGILAISIPSYRVLIRRSFPKLLGSYSGGQSDRYSGGQSDSYSHGMSEGRKKSRNYGLRSFEIHERALGMDVMITGVGSKRNSEEQILVPGVIPDGKIMATTNVTQSVVHGREPSR
ncbi:hypothetical protein FN846DRAFT_514101 [Sphaerosporella brunnea]|uniref:Rhodopsin domain-containing protein n=1 Tax=Sphaerosporella brunnea TaxID=1250544 RepID=A0A5J5EE17_9PEZI|nr:hypothetical protein FN846DRAFT_514101 [Sphaerosporella brunnea]